MVGVAVVVVEGITTIVVGGVAAIAIVGGVEGRDTFFGYLGW